MNQADFFYSKETLNGDYKELKFDFAGSVKLRVTGGTLDFSFDGSTTHGELTEAEGVLTFEYANKSAIWVKGSGTAKVWAWLGE